MKDKFLKTTSVLSLVISVFLLLNINGISENVNDIKANFSGQLMEIRNEVRGINSDVERYLEEKSNLISEYNWEYGEADYNNNTVPLYFYVTPKKYTKDKTRAFLCCGNEQYALQMENGVFKGEIILDIFGDYPLSKVIFQTGDTVEVQALDAAEITPCSDVLPNINIDFAPGYTTRNIQNQNKVHLNVDGSVFINIYAKADKHNILSAQLVEYIDGKETDRKDIDLYSKNTGNQSDLMQYIEQLKQQSEDYYNLDPEFSIERSYELDYGKVLTYSIEVRDARGYLYKAEIFRYTAKEGGGFVEDRIESIMSELRDMKIYDKDGKILYGKEIK